MESNLTTLAIVIFISADRVDVWNDVLLGIEEEGVLFVVQENSPTDIIRNIWLAVCQFPLPVDTDHSCERPVVHYKNLPTSAPLFTLAYQQNSYDHRSVDSSAARLVKGILFWGYHL